MKTLFITIIILVSINFSGCAVPYIVKNITEEVLEGKALQKAQQQSAVAFVNRYITASNADDSTLIANMTTTEFTTEKKRFSHAIKLVGEPTILVQEHIAIVWTSFSSTNNSNYSHCGTSSFQLVKDNDEWKMAHVAWSVEQTDCQSNAI